MTIAAGAVAAPQPSLPQDSTLAQNLFEHAAAHAQGLPQGAGPAQLGQQVMQNLQGYVERSGSLAERAGRLGPQTRTTPHDALVSLAPGQAPALPAQPAPPQVDGSQMERAIQSLSMMFDHAIETQLVVRGATQVAGAANTLLRGQ